MMRTILLVLPILLLACRRGNPEDSALSGPAPPGATLSAVTNLSLDQALQMLEREVVLSLRNEGDVTGHLTRAEAISDGLLETRMPFPWITSRAYGVEPMLRQIQTLADRILAERRSNVRPEVIKRDLMDLHELVRGLRVGLRTGGGKAPAPLDSLLARYAADTLAATSTGGGE